MTRIALIMALAAGVAVSYGNRTHATGTVGDNDKEFVQELMIANMAEVELGQIAVEHGADLAVKSFGQLMVDDHMAARDTLADVARESDIVTPSALDRKHQDLRDKLSELRGSTFDREYMDAMVQGHDHVMSRLESRLDHSGLAGWKIRMDDADHGWTAGLHNLAPITPEFSTNPHTMAINEWAAASYPVVYSHYRTAKILYDKVKGTPSRTE